MSGSVAEERIRLKAEALLRRLFPDARIIHELVLRQGGERIDLAAVTPGFVALIEIKSERDVLTRLKEQAASAKKVGDLFGVCVAAKHAEKVRAIRAAYHSDEYADFAGLDILAETDDGFETRYTDFHDGWGARARTQAQLCSPAHRLEMLWASELQHIAGRKGMPRQPAKHLICETMTGRQIREAVCAALRSRPFPRADAAIPLPDFCRAAA